MGQAKYNPTAIAAKRGEQPPKPTKMSTAESRRRMQRVVEHLTGADTLYRAMGVKNLY